PGTANYRAIVSVGDIADTLRETVVKGGEGIIGNLLVSGKAEYINDTASDPRGVQIPGTEQTSDERLMVVPLGTEGAIAGAMAVWRTGGDPFDDRELEFLTGLSRQATVALRNAHLFDETHEALEQQTATAEVLDVISHSMADASPVFDKIIECCERLFTAHAFALGIVDDRGQVTLPVFRITASTRKELGEEEARAVEESMLAAFPRPLAGTLTERAIRSGKLVE